MNNKQNDSFKRVMKVSNGDGADQVFLHKILIVE